MNRVGNIGVEIAQREAAQIFEPGLLHDRARRRTGIAKRRGFEPLVTRITQLAGKGDRRKKPILADHRDSVVPVRSVRSRGRFRWIIGPWRHRTSPNLKKMAGKDRDGIISISFCSCFVPAFDWHCERTGPPSSTMSLMHVRQGSEKRSGEIAGFLTTAYQSDGHGIEKPST